MLSWLFSNLDQPAHRPCGHSWMAPGQMIPVYPVTEIIQICDSGLRDGHDLQEILRSC